MVAVTEKHTTGAGHSMGVDFARAAPAAGHAYHELSSPLAREDTTVGVS